MANVLFPSLRAALASRSAWMVSNVAAKCAFATRKPFLVKDWATYGEAKKDFWGTGLKEISHTVAGKCRKEGGATLEGRWKADGGRAQ